MITVSGRLSLRPAGTFTVEAETAEQAHDLVVARLQAEKFLEMDNGDIHKVENLSETFKMRRVKLESSE